jgi:hypothetical protein
MKASPRLSRRTLLELGSVSAALSLSACTGRDSGARSGAAGSGAATATGPAGAAEAPSGSAGAPPGDLVGLADRIAKASREGALGVAVSALRAGATHETLLGAAFLAGVREIDPATPGGKLHCVMAVESAWQLAEGAPRADALRLALWTIDDFKVSQKRDVDDGDWVLEPRPDVTFADAGAARRELVAAMEAWDEARADRAVTGLAERAEPAAIFEVLWPYACRSFSGAGHKMIHASLVARALGRLGREHAVPVLRTVVRSLLVNDRSDRGTASYDAARPRLSRLGAAFPGGKDAPEQSLSLAKALRASDMDAAQDLIGDAARSGLSAATVWDGLRLFAAELFLRRAASRPADQGRALFPVHGVTACEALGHAFDATSDAGTKRLLILQAAGWLVSMRDAFVLRVGLSKDGPWLDGLAPREDVENTVALLDAPTPEGALGLLERRPAEARPMREALVGQLARKAVEHHQLKYAAAMLAEAHKVNPRWSAHLVAPALPYLPVPADPVTAAGERIEAAVREAG